MPRQAPPPHTAKDVVARTGSSTTISPTGGVWTTIASVPQPGRQVGRLVPRDGRELRRVGLRPLHRLHRRHGPGWCRLGYIGGPGRRRSPRCRCAGRHRVECGGLRIVDQHGGLAALRARPAPIASGGPYVDSVRPWSRTRARSWRPTCSDHLTGTPGRDLALGARRASPAYPCSRRASVPTDTDPDRVTPSGVPGRCCGTR